MKGLTRQKGRGWLYASQNQLGEKQLHGMGENCKRKDLITESVSFLPYKDEGTKAFKSKAGQIEGRRWEGMLHSGDHDPGGSFCRDDADACEQGQHRDGQQVLER